MRVQRSDGFWRRQVRRPLDDYLAALTACVIPLRLSHVILILSSCAASWWIYVPIHELAHAYGCIWTGGEVTRLEIDAMYGARLLQRVFPFVTVGSDYAGQLKGFDTRGSDLTYLATDFAPYLLTMLIGVPWLRSIPTKGDKPLRTSIEFGAALPMAYVPFISIPGDYYEMGSILVSRLVAVWSSTFNPARWRSDDVVKLVAELFSSSGAGHAGDLIGVLLSFTAGVVLAFATYTAGAWVAAVTAAVRR